MTMIKTQFLLLSSIIKTRLDEVYPNVFIALRIMLNCPETSSSAERSFSKLELIKTFNRSHMTESRLSSLTMLSIEASRVRSLHLVDVIKAFACQRTRSKPFWYWPTIMWHCFRYFRGFFMQYFSCVLLCHCDFFCFAVWLRSASWVAMR